MPLADGEQFAGYRIVRMLGSGGMGEVYLARHPRLPRHDALKVLPAVMSSNAEFRERFNREADIAATLSHPHVVGIHDRGEFNGQLWISMDYIDGTDAGRLLRDRFPQGLPPHDVADIVIAVADALDNAHDSGMLHRDVKPANILIGQSPSGRRRILLADFGISRWMADTSGLTQTNMAVGTVSYAAPEQLTGDAVDGRTDQYALAATAFQLLTGSPPFEHANPAVVVGQHLSSPPPSLAGRNPALGRLDAVMHTALAKKPSDRFARCSDFADALSSYLASDDRASAPNGPTMSVIGSPRPPTAVLPAVPPVGTAKPAPTPFPHAPFAPMPAPVTSRRSPWPLVIGVVAVAFVVAGLVLALRPWQSSPANSASSANPPVAQTDGPPGTPVEQAPMITFDSMRNFITDYYGELPTRASDAWSKLDVGYQQRTGLSDYLNFWSTVRSVTVISVQPRDSTSIVAHMQYVGTDGHALTDDRWFRVVSVNGALLIGDSELVG